MSIENNEITSAQGVGIEPTGEAKQTPPAQDRLQNAQIPTAEPKQPEAAIEPKGDFDYGKYESEFLQSGDIGEASREELYRLFPKNLVDNYIDNMKEAHAYASERSMNKAYEAVGGKESFEVMIEWAGKNLSDEEKQAYNDAVSGGNEGVALMAIRGLYARSRQGAIRKPSLLMGGADNSKYDPDTFLTRQDYANAVADERYAKSPQYRAEIDAKLAKTLKNGGFSK